MKPEFNNCTINLNFGGAPTRQMIAVSALKDAFNFSEGRYQKENAPDGVYILTDDDTCIAPGCCGTNGVENAVGIAVIKDDRKLVVALSSSEEELRFLNESISATKNQFSSIDDARCDINGKSNTLQLVEKDSPAAKFCHEYSCGKISAGNWYLPSFGEMKLMWEHRHLIDASLILCGGKPLHFGWHWTSTERSSGSAWCLFWDDGATDHFFKYGLNQVRPVSAF